MNDHKALTNRVEEIVKKLLEESSSGGNASNATMTTAATTAVAAAPAPPPAARPAAAAPRTRLIPFARVGDVAASSPAQEAGMQVGDRVVSFGTVSVSVPSSSSSSSSSSLPPSAGANAPLSRLPAEVAAALAAGRSIDVVVLRAGAGGIGGGGGVSEGGGGGGGGGIEGGGVGNAPVREVSLRLTPREGWGGRGALGCHLRPL